MRSVWEFSRRWFPFGVAIACVGVVAFALFSPMFEVREISIQRTQTRVDVRQVVSALTSIYGKHLVFVSTHDVSAPLQEVIPDLDTVTIRKSYPHKLIVRVTLKPVVARLLIEGSKSSVAPGLPEPPVVGSGAGFFNPALQKAAVQKYDYLTENGIYVSTPSAQSGSSLLTLTIVDWAVRPVPGTPLLSPALVQRIRDTEAALAEQFGQQSKGRTVYVRGQEYHLDMGGFSLWFDVKSPLEDQLARYRIFLKAVGTKEVKRYVDLRLNGRVVFR